MTSKDVDKIVSVLNDVLEKDPKVMIGLLSLLIPAKKELTLDYELRYSRNMNLSCYGQFGILTLINKIIEDTNYKIVIDNVVDGGAEIHINSFKKVKK